MQSLPKILVINNSADQDAMNRILKVSYDVHFSHPENDFLSESCVFNPDLIIIELMNDSNKIKVLERLRNCPDLSETPLLLATSDSDIDEIKRTYDYTNDDFLINPPTRKDLVGKVRSKIKRKQDLNHLALTNENKDENTYIALNEAHEIGVIIQFYRSCFSCSTSHDIISRVFLVGEKLDLKMSVFIHHNNETVFASNRSNKDTSYKNVMREALNKGRYVDMGPTTIINYEYISVLVHNMPTQHPKQYGQLKDHLSMLTSGANCCLEYMEADEILQAQYKKQTTQMAEASCTVLIEVDDYFRNESNQKRQLIETTFTALENQINALNNTSPDTTSQLQVLIEQSKNSLINAFIKEEGSDEPLDIVLDGLKKILLYIEDPYS